MKKLTLERLKELMVYDPETGIFTRIITSQGNAFAGHEAGCYHRASGYRFIQIDGARYKTHRLAWFYHHGVWPENQLDHKDRVRNHNWISNLREATNAQNAMNRPAQADNVLGLKGVCANGNGFRANIYFEGVQLRLGTYKTPEEASAVYKAKARELYGEFAYVE